MFGTDKYRNDRFGTDKVKFILNLILQGDWEYQNTRLGTF